MTKKQKKMLSRILISAVLFLPLYTEMCIRDSLIEEHDGHGLGVLPAAESADGGDGHEKVFVKDLAVADVLHRPPQYIPADNSIGDEVEQETDHPLGGDGVEEQKEDGAD